jgi:hypothetical protein
VLDRKMLSEVREVGLVEPGRDASRGNTPSPDNSIAIGMFPTVRIEILEVPLKGVLG